MIHDELLTTDIYLSRIEDITKREILSYLINLAENVPPAINARFNKTEVQPPELRIRISDKISAQASGYVIHLSSGLLEHCIGLGYFPSTLIIGGNLGMDQDLPYISGATLAWIISHEWIHELRCHQEVANHFNGEIWAWKALEFDADCTAVSLIYRAFQKMTGWEDDEQVRKLVMYSLFWGLRPLAKGEETTTHSAMAHRMHFIYRKLATLSREYGPLGDISFDEHETRVRADELKSVIESCEYIYRENFEPPEIYTWFLDLFHGDEFSDGRHQTVIDWETVSPVVHTLSRIRAVP